METNSKEISKGIVRAVYTLVGTLALLYFLYAIRSVLVYIIVALIIAMIFKPIVTFLKSKLKFSNAAAAITTIAMFILILFGFLRMFIPLIEQQGENLSLLDTEKLKENVQYAINEVTSFFKVRGFDITENVGKTNIFANIESIPEFLNSVIASVGSFSASLFSVLFITFFFIKDNKLFYDDLFTLIPKNKATKFKESFFEINNLLSRYFLGLTVQVTVVFIIYAITLSIAGVPNAMVIAFLSALFNLIPYIGPIIGASLMVILTMTSFIGQDFQTVILPKTGGVLIGFLIAQVVDNLVSQPLIFSKSVKSHPLEIFLVIIIGGLLGGITGMVVAIPAYTVLKVVLKEFYPNNKVAKILTRDL